jgi:hypothetical protein
MDKNLIYLNRKIFFNFLCDIRLKNPEEYLTPLELVTFQQIQNGVENMLESYDENTKMLLGNEE